MGNVGGSFDSTSVDTVHKNNSKMKSNSHHVIFVIIKWISNTSYHWIIHTNTVCTNRWNKLTYVGFEDIANKGYSPRMCAIKEGNFCYDYLWLVDKSNFVCADLDECIHTMFLVFTIMISLDSFIYLWILIFW